MRAWLEKMNWRMQCWMHGRYGMDALSLFMERTAFVLIVLTLFIRIRFISSLGMVLLLLAVFRMCSKNFARRERELAAYERIIKRPRAFFNLQRRKFTDRKTYRYFKCSCGKTLRVPKGHGKVQITCPNCHEHLIRKS